MPVYVSPFKEHDQAGKIQIEPEPIDAVIEQKLAITPDYKTDVKKGRLEYLDSLIASELAEFCTFFDQEVQDSETITVSLFALVLIYLESSRHVFLYNVYTASSALFCDGLIFFTRLFIILLLFKINDGYFMF